MIPKIVCLCGSTRFGSAFAAANLQETLAGNIVLSVGSYIHSDDELFYSLSESDRDKIKHRLDQLHLWKVCISHEILVLNVGGYIGPSTSNEIRMAQCWGKPIRYWEPELPTKQHKEWV